MQRHRGHDTRSGRNIALRWPHRPPRPACHNLLSKLTPFFVPAAIERDMMDYVANL